MTDSETDRFVGQIHSSGRQVVLAITGGGSEAIGGLLRVPGASRTVLEALVPYSAKSLVQFLGAKPEHFCTARTARAMAMAAYWRAVELAETDGATPADPDAILGLGCTASLASDRPKQGPHRAHVAIQAAGFTATVSLELTKDARSRAAEEQLVTRLILNQLATACGLVPRQSSPLAPREEAFRLAERDDYHRANQLDLELLPGEHVISDRTDAPEDWRELLLGAVDAVCLGEPPAAEEHGSDELPASGVIFSGAFNPLHEGHRHMAQVAAEKLGLPIEFEISIENVDKPPLDYTEISQRAAQFPPDQPLWLTRAATFVDKSAIFPGTIFVVGVDTITRIADPRYYGEDQAACQRAIAAIAERGCRFLVFGRRTPAGFETLADLNLPPELAAICDSVPEDRFREDVSSTEIRKLNSPANL